LHQQCETEKVPELVRLALGMADPGGPSGEAEHKIGTIPASGASAEQVVFDLANAIEDCPATSRLSTVSYEQSIPNLKLGVGSEIAMMLKPTITGVGDKRTGLSHLPFLHRLNQSRANGALAGCRGRPPSSVAWNGTGAGKRTGADLAGLDSRRSPEGSTGICFQPSSGITVLLTRPLLCCERRSGGLSLTPAFGSLPLCILFDRLSWPFEDLSRGSRSRKGRNSRGRTPTQVP
jgi:hypothetical protein